MKSFITEKIWSSLSRASLIGRRFGWEGMFIYRKRLWWEAHTDPSMATTFTLTERLVLRKEVHFFSCSIFSAVILTSSRSNNTPHLYIAVLLQPSSQLKSLLIGVLQCDPGFNEVQKADYLWLKQEPLWFNDYYWTINVSFNKEIIHLNIRM